MPGDPNNRGTIYALAVNGGTVFAGGLFFTVGGQTRNYLAAIDATTAGVKAWNPNASGVLNIISPRVLAPAVSGGTVYAGGNFTSVGGNPRNGIAALDATTGIATGWNPNANGAVNALAVSGSTVYAGGYFTSIGGLIQPRLAGILMENAPVSVPNPHDTPTQSDLTLLSANPTSGSAQVQYSVARAGRVRVDLLDVSGRVEETLADRIHTPGRYVVTWDGVGRHGRVSPGLYFIRLVAPDQVIMKKLAIIQ